MGTESKHVDCHIIDAAPFAKSIRGEIRARIRAVSAEIETSRNGKHRGSRA